MLQNLSHVLLISPWAARYNTWLLIRLTPKGVDFSFLFSVHLFGLSLFLLSVSAVAYRLPTAPAHLHSHCLKLQMLVLHQRHQPACVLMPLGIRVTLACSVQQDSS